MAAARFVAARAARPIPHRILPENLAARYPSTRLTAEENVTNRLAEAFYRQHGVERVEKAFELSPRTGVPLMFTKHCLRYSMGWCPVHQKGQSPYKEPYYLRYKDTLLRLRFRCDECRMEISVCAGPATK